MSTKLLTTLALLSLFAAAGCTGDRLGGDLKFPWQEEKKKEEPRPVFSMGGRWMLTSPNRGQCVMTFSGPPKATEGTIAPGGGCPGSFFTSRRWTLENGNVIVRDHNGEQLAQLSPSGMGTANFFEGKATTGESIMLARQ